MSRWLLLVCCSLLATLGLTGVAHAQANEVDPTALVADTASPADAAPLDLVITQVKAALDQYQQGLGSEPDALPALSSAEFDFKTSTATTVGGSISFFIFKIGGSHEKDVCNDVTFKYSVPPPPKGLTPHSKPKPPTLTEELVSTIQAAATAVKSAGKLGPLGFSQLTVTIQYGVKWDGSLGVNVPISFVTVGLNGDKNKNTVQTVKLVFGK
jgi:hypothetical protein